MIKKSILALLPIALLCGCVVPTGPVEVTRFNKVAEGEQYGQGSYVVELADADDDGKAPLESKANPIALSPYIASVQREMKRQGYTLWLGQQRSDQKADYTTSIRLRVNNRVIQGRSPVSVGVGGGTGRYRSGVGVGVGLNLGGGAKERVVTSLSVRIRRNSDNQVVWEGRAEQEAGKKSPAAQPGIAASKLAEALFAGFPGQNGETVTVE